MKELFEELKNKEASFIRGGHIERSWEGFDPKKNIPCVDERSIQRSMLLSYCQIVGKYLDLSDKRGLEIGVEKHRHIGLNLGLSEWERLDRLEDMGGNKTDYFFDFVEDEIPQELIGAFDVVMCSNTLEHTFDIMKGFERTFDFAHAGSFVYCSTPFSIGVHCSPDYWRLTPQVYEKVMPNYSDEFIVLEENYAGTLHGVSCFAIKR